MTYAAVIFICSQHRDDIVTIQLLKLNFGCYSLKTNSKCGISRLELLTITIAVHLTMSVTNNLNWHNIYRFFIERLDDCADVENKK